METGHSHCTKYVNKIFLLKGESKLPYQMSTKVNTMNISYIIFCLVSAGDARCREVVVLAYYRETTYYITPFI